MIKEMVKGEKEKMLERNLYIHNNPTWDIDKFRFHSSTTIGETNTESASNNGKDTPNPNPASTHTVNTIGPRSKSRK